MKDQVNFTGWDFTDTWRMSSAVTYDGYPTLEWAKGYSRVPIDNEIADMRHIVWLAEDTGRWSGEYTQTADINAWWTCGWDYQKGWTPVGNSTVRFTGVYEGNHQKISGLYVHRNTTDDVGLFGQNSGLLRDIFVEDAHITGKDKVGVLVGFNRFSSASIIDCSSSGRAYGKEMVGGLVGLHESAAIITASYSRCAVEGEYRVGGLVGRSNGGHIYHSFATGNVTGTGNGANPNLSNAGGFVGGVVGGAQVIYCHSTGDVSGMSNVGGFIGSMNGSIISVCFSTGNSATKGASAGGFIGLQTRGTIKNCYSRGNVVREDGSSTWNGGFVGRNWRGIVTNSYATGRIIYANGTNPTNRGFSGPVDTGDDYHMEANYWDVTTSQQTSSEGNATGKTTTEMWRIDTFTGWDMEETSADYIGYPYPGLSMTVEGPIWWISPLPVVTFDTPTYGQNQPLIWTQLDPATSGYEVEISRDSGVWTAYTATDHADATNLTVIASEFDSMGTRQFRVRAKATSQYDAGDWGESPLRTIAKASQTITYEGGAWQSKIDTDDPFALSASASSGLTVSFASSVSVVATVSDNTVIIHGAGITTITASQAGNDNYTAAPDVSHNLTVWPTDVTWTGEGGDDNTSTDANWDKNLHPYVGTNTLMRFAGATRLTPYIDFIAESDFGAIYFESGAASFTLGGNALTIHSAIQNNADNTQTIQNNIALGDNITVQATAEGDLILAGVLSGIAHITVESGNGIVRLTNIENTYTGMTSIKNGAVLGGRGNASSATTVKSGGAIAPGSSIGTFSTADLTMEAGSEFICDISSTIHDQIIVNGTLHLPTGDDHTTIVIPDTSSLAINTDYALVTCDLLGSGNAGNVTVDDRSAFEYDIYITVNSDGVMLTTLPEPGVFGAIFLVFLGFWRCASRCE